MNRKKLLCLALALLSILGSSPGATLTVVSTADNGPGSLRQAILDANADASPGVVTIAFNIPGGGVQTIAPLTPLPTITHAVTIDGYTQPGTSPNTLTVADNAVLLIELNGVNLSGVSDNGLYVQGSGSTVRGLVINRFAIATGLYVQDSDNNVIEGNFIGTDATGTNVLANFRGIAIYSSVGNRIGGLAPASRNIIGGSSESGISLTYVCTSNQVFGNYIGLGADGLTVVSNTYGIGVIDAHNQIGGPAPGARNIISGNRFGCTVGSGTIIQGNFIGTDASGTLRRGNHYGIHIPEARNNLIGGTVAGEGNLISGNESGVVIQGDTATNNVVAGNLIGTDVTGRNALGNGNYGVLINGVSGNFIGGTNAGARNVISANGYAGVSIVYPAATGNVVAGNFIGTDNNGTNALGNAPYGVLISVAGNNTIGGTAPGAGNLISGNDGTGVAVIGADATNNVVLGNLIGTDVTGTNALGNETGIFVSEGAGNRIGGLTPASRNIISGNSYGISQNGTEGTVILGNYFGLGVDGTAVVSNTFGIFLHYSSRTQIGGSAPGARNVISGNLIGCYLNVGGSNIIQGNFIGTDASGTLPRGNVQGVALNESRHNLIGGSAAGAGNLLSGNSSAGLSIGGLDANTNLVTGNLIGTDVTGTSALGNGDYGVFIGGTLGNVIGGTTPGAGNVISGSGLQGIAIWYGGAGNVIQGNFIGTDVTGTLAVSNRISGVLIDGSPGNLIGGTMPGAGNVIAFTTYAGVGINEAGATNNAVFGNRIFANGSVGIDLAFDGVTPNDPGDADGSPNHFQNFPEITSVALAGGNLTVRCRVDSAVANSVYPLTVEFFLADSAASGEGRTFLYRHTYATPQTFTNITFTPAAAVNDGDPIVATATDANGNTSEFSAVAVATVNHTPVVANLIPNQNALYGSGFTYVFPANTFSDPDAADSLSYGASGMPAGIVFTPATRTFSGTPTNSGTFNVTVTATDDGSPSLSTNDVFDIVVTKPLLTVTADNKSRLPGQPNPLLTGTVIGVTNNDTITATFITTANEASPIGSYPITPLLSDPHNRLLHYTVTTNAGTLTVANCSTLFIANATLPAGTRSIPYSQTLSAGGGVPPYAFAVTAGTLPGGLTLSASGLLSGTPDASGGFSCAVSVTDALGCTSASNYFININPFTLVVTSLGNSGPGTLRQIIADANAGDRIEFAVTGTIALQSSLEPLHVDKPLTIAGPGATNLLIRIANVYSRIFTVDVGPTIISGLTLAGGDLYNFNIIDPEGAAIRNTAHLTLDSCEVTNNVALGSGGAVLNTGGSATLIAVNCTFADNAAASGFVYFDGAGGAIWSDGTLRVTNCTFSGNSSPRYGGAIYSSGNAVIASSTIARNQTYHFESGAGGIYNDGGTLTLRNSILAGNINYGDGLDAQDVGGAITTGDYNLIKYTNNLAVPGTHDVLGVDPLLSPLQRLGGPTRTHGLASTSPALNVADAATSPATDQRGVARPQGAGHDIGAFEGALPLNHPPVLANPIPDQNGAYNSVFSYTIPANTFIDSDAGQTLTYVASGAPPNIFFDPLTRTFSGTLRVAGTNTVTVIATDDGAPPLSTADSFNIIAPRLPVTARADNQSRVYGDFNPFFSLTYFGMEPGDGAFVIDNPPIPATTATETSPVGVYPIVVSGGSDDVYDIVGLTNGTLTVTPAPLRVAVESVFRRVGMANPPLLASISGLRNADNITATLATTATPFSPVGEYPIAATLNDPDGKLGNYTVTLTTGILSVVDFDVDYRVLRPFGFTNQMARFPSSRLIEGSNGWLYGTTPNGGVTDAGGVYRVRSDGSGFTVLHHFSGSIIGTNEDGRRGWGGVTLASDGVLYGVTTRGGFTNNGTLYKLNLDGSGYAVLRRFGQTAGDGTAPPSPLIEGSDGVLYGTTYFGGTSNVGTVFKVNKNGSGYAVLHSFGGSDGNVPESGVIEGRDGMLYGTTDSGTVFKLAKDGSGFAVIAASGAARAPLVQGSDGFLYGVTPEGGSVDAGALFRVNTNGAGFTVLHNFGATGGDGGFLSYYLPAPVSLIEGTNGELFGVTQLGGSGNAGAVFAVNKDGSNYRILRSFVGGFSSTDGREPTAGLLQARDGALYGTTSVGGTAYDGTLFKISVDGTGYSTLWNFVAGGGDVANPAIALVEGTNGVLYGGAGGALFKVNRDGTGYALIHQANLIDGIAYPQALVAGTDGALYGLARGLFVEINGVFTSFPDRFFRVNPDGSGYTNLHSFEFLEGLFDSSYFASLIESSNGVFYGTAATGGEVFNGTLFRVNRDGSGFTVLHSFAGGEGGTPTQVLKGSDGRLYGILAFASAFGGGALFAINTNGTGYTNLHAFGGTATDGTYPVACLLEGSDGRLYGATSAGGLFGSGALFAINKDGAAYSILRSLGASPSDARVPSGLAEGADGYLYGTSVDGGNKGGAAEPGTIFRLRKDGSGYIVLHRFYASSDDGYDPVQGLHLSGDGAFYGVTTFGGLASGFSSFGTVYRLFLDPVPPNLPPVLNQPIADQSGAYGSPFNFTFAANTFTDPDPGQALSYTASGQPPGVSFAGSTRTFSGTPAAGTYAVTVTATDNGAPPLQTNDTFNIVVAKALLTVTANHTNRTYGETNPVFTGILSGLVPGDNITATFSTTATATSPPGSYPIAATLQDLNSLLDNYTVITNVGTLTVAGVQIQSSLSGSTIMFCWPASAPNLSMEYTDDLTPPVAWHPVTSGVATNGPTVCHTTTPTPALASRFYRLRLSQ